MAPSDYIQSRQLAAQVGCHDHDQYFATLVDGRPYLPNFTVNAAASNSSVCHAALVILVHSIYIAVSGISDAEIENVDGSDTLAANNSKAELKPIISISMDWDSLVRTSSTSLACTKVTGGITNALFRVSGFETLKPVLTGAVMKLLGNNGDGDVTLLKNDVDALLDFNSVLIRIFGAEGMIDRDVETSTYAALCDADIAYRYLGRFKNGRIEGWLDGFEALTCADLATGDHSAEIAKEMARLHCCFQLPHSELRDHHYGTDANETKVGLWDQLSSWMEQAKGYTAFKTEHDTERVKLLELDKIELEVQYFISSFASASSDAHGANRNKDIVFCHNDLLPANIMLNQQSKRIQFIDFEYGGVGYAAYDIANHLNEYAGGTSAEDNGVPDYSRFPTPDKQKAFCEEYLRAVRRYEGVNNLDAELHSHEVNDLLGAVLTFLLVNHLYWGLWAVNQAAEEGCDGFDYISFATNRFKQFYAMKET